MKCQCLERGCIHYVLLRVGRRKTMLVISSSCSADFFKSTRPLLLHFPIPSVPVISSQEDEFVCPGCSRNHRIQIIIELVFDSELQSRLCTDQVLYQVELFYAVICLSQHCPSRCAHSMRRLSKVSPLSSSFLLDRYMGSPLIAVNQPGLLKQAIV